MQIDPEALGNEIAALVRDVTIPLQQEMQALRTQIAQLPAPINGKDADPALVRTLVADAVAAIPAPQDGKSVDLASLAGTIIDAAAKAVDALPKPRDGKDADPVLVKDLVRTLVADAVAALPKRETTPLDAAALAGEITRAAELIIKAMPAATLVEAPAFDPQPIVDAAVQRAVIGLPPAKDGAPGKDADPQQAVQLLRTLAGDLVDAAVASGTADMLARFTAVENSLAALPPLHQLRGAAGADGQDGAAGRDADPDAVAQALHGELAQCLAKRFAALDAPHA